MNRFFIAVYFFMACLSEAQTPSWQWVKSGTCTTSDNASAVSVDPAGNVYTTGYFYGSNLLFNSTTLTNAGNYDCFLVKHDNAGNFIWAKNIGGAFDEVGTAVCTDASGNVFVTGYFTSNTLPVGSTTLNNIGGTDVFIAKFDPNGTLLWAKQFGGNMNDEGNGITCDQNNNVLIAGMFESGMISFGTGTLSTIGSGDAYVAKYDNNGNELWARNFGGSGMDICNAISTTTLNEIYATGNFKSANITFSTGLLINQGNADFFMAKYDAAGNEIWAKSAGGNFDDSGQSVLCISNEIFTTGYYKSTNITFGTITFSNAGIASADVFLISYTSGGTELWTSSYGGNQDDIGYGLTVDPGGTIYMAGHIHSPTISFGTYTLNCSGIGDAFITKFDKFGNLIWADNVGAAQDEGIGGLDCDAAGNVFAGGFFYSPSVNFSSQTINNNGNSDLFVSKLLSTSSGFEEKHSESSEPVLYPNPASQGFYLSHTEKNSTIQIYDIAGNIIQSHEVRNNFPEYIETKDLARGIYFVKIASQTTNHITKLIVY